MPAARNKRYIQLMIDLPVLRRARADTDDLAATAALDREIDEHECEILRRNRHGR